MGGWVCGWVDMWVGGWVWMGGEGWAALELNRWSSSSLTVGPSAGQSSHRCLTTIRQKISSSKRSIDQSIYMEPEDLCGATLAAAMCEWATDDVWGDFVLRYNRCCRLPWKREKRELSIGIRFSSGHCKILEEFSHHRTCICSVCNFRDPCQTAGLTGPISGPQCVTGDCSWLSAVGSMWAR